MFHSTFWTHKIDKSSFTRTFVSAAQQKAFHSFTGTDKWVELLGLKTSETERTWHDYQINLQQVLGQITVWPFKYAKVNSLH